MDTTIVNALIGAGGGPLVGLITLTVTLLNAKRAQVLELQKECNRLWDRNALLEEKIDELRKRTKQAEQQVEPHVAAQFERNLQELEEAQEPDEEENEIEKAEKLGYWVIAPFTAEEPEMFRRVWKFDLENNLISIGWSDLGDISALDKARLRSLIDKTYPNDPAGARGQACAMLWKFYHSIKLGDIIVARQGTKKIVAVGTVRRTAYYDQTRSRAVWPGEVKPFANHLDVEWRSSPRDKVFPKAVFGPLTLCSIPEARFRYLVNAEVK